MSDIAKEFAEDTDRLVEGFREIRTQLEEMGRENGDLYVENLRLKHENEQLQEDKEVLEQRVEDLRHSVEESHRNTLEIGKDLSDSIDRYEKKISTLEKKIRKLEAENWKLKETSDYVHNARGAGRKKHNAEYVEKYNAFCDLVRAGESMPDIMETMQISRSTYFRFLRSYKADNPEHKQ